MREGWLTGYSAFRLPSVHDLLSRGLVGGTPAHDAEAVLDCKDEPVMVVVSIGSLGDRHEPTDHRVLRAHNAQQPIDLRGVTYEFGLERDVIATEPYVCRLSLDEVELPLSSSRRKQGLPVAYIADRLFVVITVLRPVR